MNDRVGGPGDGEHADEEGDEKPLNVKIIKMNKQSSRFFKYDGLSRNGNSSITTGDQ